MTGVWNAIYKINKELTDLDFNIAGVINGGLGDGTNIRFWIDKWIGNEPLMVTFPNLFIIEGSKGCTVAERLKQVGPVWVGNWEWKRALLLPEEMRELQLIEQIISGSSLTAEKDKWTWSLNSDGRFSTASCRNLLTVYAAPFYPFLWSKWVPKKVNLMVWRAEQERLPTLEGLKRRNIGIQEDFCRLCGDQTESAQHLFIDCYFAANVWNKISGWCKTQPIYAFNLKDLIETYKVTGMGRVKKKAFHAVILTACWILWKKRNDKIFNGRNTSLEHIMAEIQAVSYIWVKNRAKSECIDWEKWRRFEF